MRYGIIGSGAIGGYYGTPMTGARPPQVHLTGFATFVCRHQTKISNFIWWYQTNSTKASIVASKNNHFLVLGVVISSSRLIFNYS